MFVQIYEGNSYAVDERLIDPKGKTYVLFQKFKDSIMAYMAHVDGEQVVIKAGASPMCRRHAAREAATLRAFATKNPPGSVVTMRDEFTSSSGVPCIVLPHLEGIPLDKEIQTNGCFSVRESMHVLDDLLSAHQYAHTFNIYDRDIKPNNIFHYQGRYIRLDWGLSAPGGENATNGLIEGSMPYMTPEMVQGEERNTPQIEVYQAGAIAYEILGGHAPYHDVSLKDKWELLLSSTVSRRPERLAGHVPPSIRTVIERAMHPNPDHRFSTLEEFAHAYRDEAARAIRNPFRRLVSFILRPAPESEVVRWETPIA